MASSAARDRLKSKWIFGAYGASYYFTTETDKGCMSKRSTNWLTDWLNDCMTEWFYWLSVWLTECSRRLDAASLRLSVTNFRWNESASPHNSLQPPAKTFPICLKTQTRHNCWLFYKIFSNTIILLLELKATKTLQWKFMTSFALYTNT